ncbi:MAG TPA: c-type cytochrome [Solirubrobacterales bacterium]|jgi:mono/diheme cytochrome c family protein|nr:c-type cytochrome [Solirubrobacterales bacterium]
MQNLPKPIRRLAPLAALLAAVLVIAGCGTTSPDIARGRVLFTSKCGVCHTLAQAGTTATIGPNLDDAFAAAREAGGFDAATVEGIVKNQIDNPRPSNGNPAASMPAHIAEGTDADDIAAYVGKYAGVPGAAPPEVEGGAGAQVFANNGCGGCHTLAVANSGGTTGPDLDEVLPGQSEAEIQESIEDPNAKIAQGYPANVMPQNFKETIQPEELKELVKFLSENAGKSKE